MTNRRAIKRYGVNPYGANPNWVRDVRVVGKDEPIKDGYEEVLTVSEYNLLIKSQRSDIDNWIASISGTKLSNIDTSWGDLYTDYNQARRAVRDEVSMQGGFSGLTDNDKIIAAKWFAVEDDNIDTIFSLNEKMKNAITLNKESMVSRQNRYGAVFIFVRNILEREDLNKIANDMDEHGFIGSYVTRGREGTNSINYQGDADPEGLLDYILGTPGTSFEVDNMLSRIGVPKYGISAQDVVNKSYDIFVNGNY